MAVPRLPNRGRMPPRSSGGVVRATTRLASCLKRDPCANTVPILQAVCMAEKTACGVVPGMIRAPEGHVSMPGERDPCAARVPVMQVFPQEQHKQPALVQRRARDDE